MMHQNGAYEKLYQPGKNEGISSWKLKILISYAHVHILLKPHLLY